MYHRASQKLASGCEAISGQMFLVQNGREGFQPLQ